MAGEAPAGVHPPSRFADLIDTLRISAPKGSVMEDRTR
jgi:hypothetical protein